MIRQRSRSIAFAARHRIEQRKQQQAREKAADMRLPGHALRLPPSDRDRADAEDDVDAEPHREEAEHAPVAQRAPQRQRRNFCGGIGIPRENDRKLPCTKAKRIAAAMAPDTEAEAPIIGASACSWVTRWASAPAAAVTAMNR